MQGMSKHGSLSTPYRVLFVDNIPVKRGKLACQSIYIHAYLHVCIYMHVHVYDAELFIYAYDQLLTTAG